MMRKNNLLSVKFSNLELELIDYANKNNVPIIKEDGLSFLELILEFVKPKKILEIGTAIGFSAIRMHQVANSYITTIERNEEMYKLALSNIEKANFASYINVIFKDALECEELLKGEKFDLIFIDAAKAQYIKFFEMYSPLLNDNGVIVSDNMEFHGLVDCEEEVYNKQSRSVRGLIRKLRDYRVFLDSNPDFQTRLYDIGDGMAVSIRKN